MWLSSLAVCPDPTLVIRPIPAKKHSDEATPCTMRQAALGCINTGGGVINLSSALAHSFISERKCTTGYKLPHTCSRCDASSL